MRHGESQEKGQEESQEEVILLALCQKASEKLSRSPTQIRRQCPLPSGHCRFRDPHLGVML
jgi:hypothetical protein